MRSLLLALLSLPAVWLASFLVEALRPAPRRPATLPMAPGLTPQYIDVKGVTLRYIRHGDGPALVLLHTLRTQLDLFHKVIPRLAEHFTVYAVDYPGHGYSDIPKAPYDADYLSASMADFLDAIEVSEATLCGVSIGASIALILAGQHHPRVTRVIAVNPYDYHAGKGLARSSWLGRVFVWLVDIPIVGDTVMRLRNFLIMQAVMSGGVYDPASIAPELMKEMYRVGNRRDHYRGFINLLRNSASWEREAAVYREIQIPVLFIWGREDWALPAERAHDESLIPTAQSVTIERAGHFLPFDAPDELASRVIDFASHAPRIKTS